MESFEVGTTGWDAKRFAQFCNALIAAAASRHYGGGFKMSLTERITAPDLGVDALLDVPTGKALSGGFIGPCTSVFQFKFSDPTTPRSTLAGELKRELSSSLAQIATRYASLARYVLLTNRDLGPASSAIRLALQARFTQLAPSSASFELFGAAEIGALLLDYSAVALSFFPPLSLESHSSRAFRFHSMAQALHAPTEFFDRNDERERLKQFLVQEGGGLLEITGPRQIGKTSLVLAAISADERWSSSTYWALSPSVTELRNTLNSLEADRNAIIVVDDVEGSGDARALAASLLERPDRKSVLISERGSGLPVAATQALSIGRLSVESASQLLHKALEHEGYEAFDRVSHLSSGVPGVLLMYAEAARRGLNLSKPDVEMGKVDQLISEAFVPTLELKKLSAWLALAGVVDLEHLDSDERGFASLLNLDAEDLTRIKDLVGELARRGLVDVRGSKVRFDAPFVLRGLATLLPVGDQLTEGFARLTESGWARLIRALEPLADRPEVISLARAILDSPPLKRTAGLFDYAELFEACGRVVRHEAIELASRRFKESQQDLPSLLASRGSWSVLNFLRESFHVQGVALQAVDALIEAARTDTTPAMKGRPVSDRFLLPFWSRTHWQDIDVPLPERLRKAESLLDSRTADLVQIGTRALTVALSRYHFEILPSSDSLAVPRNVTRPILRAEALAYLEGAALALVRTMNTAIVGIADDAQDGLRMGLKSLAYFQCSPVVLRTVVDSLTNRALEKREMNSLRAEVGSLLKELEEVPASSTPSPEWADWLREVESVLKDSRDRLSPPNGFSDLETEVRDLFGDASRSNGDLWDWTPANGCYRSDGSEQRERALKVTERVVEKPESLDEPLFEFLSTAAASPVFWCLIGNSDTKLHWLTRLSCDRHQAAFADYVRGWNNRDSGTADAALDEMASDPRYHSLVFGATWKQEPTPLRAHRLRRIALAGVVSPKVIAHWLRLGSWVSRLSPPEEGLPLVRFLVSSDAGGSSEVIDLISALILRGTRPYPAELEPLAWEAVRKAAAEEIALHSTRTFEEAEWMKVAARLTRSDSVDLSFELIEGFLRTPTCWFDGSVKALLHSGLGQAVLQLDRRRLIDASIKHLFDAAKSAHGRLPPSHSIPLDSKSDLGAVVEAIDRSPEKASLLIAVMGSGSVLPFANAILEGIPGEQLWPLLLSRFAFSNAFFTGSIGTFAEGRIRQIDDFVETTAVSNAFRMWAHFAKESLGRQARIHEDWDSVQALWDVKKPTAGEAVAILERPPGDETRDWLVKRLIESERKGVTRKILGDDEIQSALDADASIDPKARQEWERILRQRRPAWKS